MAFLNIQHCTQERTDTNICKDKNITPQELTVNFLTHANVTKEEAGITSIFVRFRYRRFVQKQPNNQMLC